MTSRSRTMGRQRFSLVAAIPIAVAALGVSASADAAPTLADYRYFRALSVDLQGRLPTRAEIAAFEAPSFNVDTWIDAHLSGPTYAERVRRVYMDLLRLDVGPQFQFVPKAALLRRHTIMGPNGEQIYVYFRLLQRREREETDGDFCLTQAETGLQFPKYAPATGTPHPVTQEALDANTVLIRPWWLYRDYRNASPVDRYDAATWGTLYPNFTPVDGLLTDLDGSQVNEIRVCKEEAQTAETGTIFITGRGPAPAGSSPPYGRLIPLPYDTDYAKAHANEPISCLGGTSVTLATECGCGPGLERCLPTTGPNLETNAFTVPLSAPIGAEMPTKVDPEFTASWSRFWWSQEAIQFLDHIVGDDRDFREVLTGRYSFVNGPLAQFYKAIAPSTCCGGDVGNADYLSGLQFDYATPDSLFDPATLPNDLLPQDTNVWREVADRGPHASGIMTMPIFLAKYGSRRGRAHVLYNVFLCRDFVATDEKLPPSNEPNLMIRPGCSTCHVTLEPLAAYFSRVTESDWTFLPESNFPIEAEKCGAVDPADAPKGCSNFYDPAFTTAQSATLRGAYASAEHANAGPQGLAKDFTESDQFPACVSSNVTSAFLGRQLGSDDTPLVEAVQKAFVDGGYKMKPLVRALVTAEAYRNANNLSSDAWRNGGAQ